MKLKLGWADGLALVGHLMQEASRWARASTPAPHCQRSRTESYEPEPVPQCADDNKETTTSRRQG